MEATGKHAAIGAVEDIEKIVEGRRRHQSRGGADERKDDERVRRESEVGKLRKVMVHRPDLSRSRDADEP